MSGLVELKQAMEKVQEARKQATEQAKATLGPALQQFLKDNPEVKSIVWTQYTPYFNDGDPCVFGISEVYFLKTEIEEFDYNEIVEGDEGNTISTYRNETPIGKACKELAQMLNDAEEVLEEVFGDHVRVIVTSKGVDVQDYEHD